MCGWKNNILFEALHYVATMDASLFFLSDLRISWSNDHSSLQNRSIRMLLSATTLRELRMHEESQPEEDIGNLLTDTEFG